MKIIKQGSILMVLFALGMVAVSAQMYDASRLGEIVRRLETNTDRFRSSVDAAFDKNRIDDTALEDDLIGRINGFEYATDRLRERVDDNEVIRSDVEDVLSRALVVDGIMMSARASKLSKQDWEQTKNSLNDLAKSFNVAWVWTVQANPYWKTASVDRLFDRLELRSDEFRRSFNDAIDASRLNGTDAENQATELVRGFEDSVDMVEDKVDRRETLRATDVEMMLQKALSIDSFVRMHNLSPRVRRDWAQVKANIEELAMMNGVTLNWSVKPVVTRTSSR